MNVETQITHGQAGLKNMSTCMSRTRERRTAHTRVSQPKRGRRKPRNFQFRKLRQKHTQNKALSITMERCLIALGVYGFLTSSKGFDMLHSNSHETTFKNCQRKIMESMSQASQRVATTTRHAERLQRTQRLSFCHGSQSCAWGGQVMNQFPELVTEDGCSEPSDARGISQRHAFTNPTSHRHGSPVNPRQLQLCCQVGQEGLLLMGHLRRSRLC